ncbi:carbohydrate ABC transporter permease [Ornithinimicrobium cryptoxanthini]|uniref:ABC transporter permease subunit n=1 Tax=Ornithinimicrobium cryptoxanthini TaxID=2934161 RepID=A0ABY4YMC8_9MICO|nr:ABC transporter permease subunit [Ornithinimicrobium cryptoxanthini]USQ77691.1 ABC transporter permease subunit [Ornithinimicrobium cryptoxanthini]
MTDTTTETRSGAGPTRARPRSRPAQEGRWLAWVFLAPASAVLLALVLWPIVYSMWRSLFDRTGKEFIGLGNYQRIFTDPDTFTALKNNLIWVIVAPILVTVLGLIFAVLTERIRWSTAFKLVVFMPMAISFLAAGIIFRVVYEEDPNRGLANAIVTSVHDIFNDSSQYPGARPRDAEALPAADAGGFASAAQVEPGTVLQIPLVGVGADELPEEPTLATPPGEAAADTVTGTVWFDFVRGGGGTPGEIDDGEAALPGVVVQAVRDGEVVADATTDDSGQFTLEGLDSGVVQIVLPAENFAPPFRGVSWLGPGLVTPSIITAYVWMWAGFAMVLIGAGLSSIPRDALEAARIDGASEWQVFRLITVPLLAPVLTVVLVTMIINVLKIFDLIYIIAPGSSASAANVIAVQMWAVSFGGAQDFGMGSALGVFLFLLVLPAMLFNIRRFRQEQL